MAATDETTIANVYALALLELASAQGDAETVDREFGEFVAYLKIDPDFRTFATSRVIDRDGRRESLDRMFRQNMSELLLHTLQVLNQHNRLDIVTHVQAQYHTLHMHQEGIIEVQVMSAEPLSEASRARLQEALRGRTGQKVALIEHVDAAILGGMVVRVGDEQIDVSVSRQLRRFHKAVMERAAQHIYSGTDVIA